MKNTRNTQSTVESLPVQTKQFAPEKQAYPVNMQERARNRALPQQDLLTALRRHPDILAAAQIVGRWVWVRFEAIPAPAVRATLAQLGFHWNNKRATWQHPCGPVTEAVDPGDPRTKYGATPAAAAVN